MAGCDCQLQGPVLGPGRDGAHEIRVFDGKVHYYARGLQAGRRTRATAHTMQAAPVFGAPQQVCDDLLRMAENNRETIEK